MSLNESRILQQKFEEAKIFFEEEKKTLLRQLEGERKLHAETKQNLLEQVSNIIYYFSP
jgi:hypothetical protein